MLDVGVVNAILAVPPAIQAVRDLLGSKNPILAKQVETSLKNAESSLIQFSEIGVLFLEAKTYHEKLTQIDLAMGELMELVASPLRRGGFDHDAFDREKIFSGWRRIRDVKEFLPSLLYFLASVRKLSSEPLLLESANVAGGPKEFQLFVIYRNSIDGAIRSYDPKTPVCKEDICDKIDQFSHHVRHQMLSADGMIIANATALGEALRDLRKRLPQ